MTMYLERIALGVASANSAPTSSTHAWLRHAHLHKLCWWLKQITSFISPWRLFQTSWSTPELMGLFHSIFFHCNSEISFCSYPNYNELIITNFRTWHESCADVVSDNICSHRIDRSEIVVNGLSIENKFWWENRLWNRPQGSVSISVSESVFPNLKNKRLKKKFALDVPIRRPLLSMKSCRLRSLEFQFEHSTEIHVCAS